jgi:hypothetical protein
LASSNLISFAPDSVWMWDVKANSNLGPGIPQRNGFLLFTFDGGTTLVEGGGVMYDGDPETAFDPDDFTETTDIERNSTIYIDLGTTFGVNRIRLFPRLDADNRNRFLRAFSLATNDGLQDGNITELRYESVFNLFATNPNREPVLEHRFDSREVRYIRIVPRAEQAWEIAELEIYSDGTLPVGQLVSFPLAAPTGTRPLWGQMRFDGGDLNDFSGTVQTRSGPDREPEQFFRLTGVGNDRLRVTQGEYLRLDEEEKGPVLPSPSWSTWETVTDGLVPSPGVESIFIQFRVFMAKPGTVLRRLTIEYIDPPIAEALSAEITPVLAVPGTETPFTLSLRANLRTVDPTRTLRQGDTGFQHLELITDAEITAISAVRINDEPVNFTADIRPGQGAGLRLWRRIVQDGTFIQVDLRARVFRDATRFGVQAADRRQVDEELVWVQQSARQEDIDPLSLGGSLVVRLDNGEGILPLVTNLNTTARVFSPNGDDINERFWLRYDLLKLTQPVQVSLDFFDLSGRSVRQLDLGKGLSGRHVQSWDGRDEQGRRVSPGNYIYRLRIQGDSGEATRHGTVGVAY